MNLNPRYQRQIILPEIGPIGQEKLRNSKVTIVGAGGLGCAISQILVRGGVGQVTLYDDDKIALSNLHRQILFDENDIGKFKAETAAKKLSKINTEVSTTSHITRISNENAADLFASADLVIDATDNISSRYILNRAAIIADADWMYGGCEASIGNIMLFCSKTNQACFECMFGPEQSADKPNPSQMIPQGPATPVVVGAIQASEAIKYLIEKNNPNQPDKPCLSRYISINLGMVNMRANQLPGKNPECDACKPKK